MFSDSSVSVTGFGSSPDAERISIDSSCQTTNLSTLDKSSQTSESLSTDSQAVCEETSKNLKSPVLYDVDRLLTFLKKVTPYLEEELENCETVDDNLNFNKNDAQNFCDEFDAANSEKFELSPPVKLSIQFEHWKDKIISDLSWNSTGTLLAVSVSEETHEGWCCHETLLAIYNISKEKFEKCPSHILKTSSCARCIKFHPYIPSLLAAGFYSGDVAVWDLTNDEELLLTNVNKNKTKGHTDTVTSLSWREDRNGIWMVTTGRDGKIIFWKITVSDLTYKSKERFLVTKQHLLPRVSSSDEHLEIAGISFWTFNESKFVVAAGTHIFLCCSIRAKPFPSLPDYKDPVCDNYVPHKGLVTCVSCHIISDLFASCGTDSAIHIYECETTAPLYMFYTTYPVMGISWINTSNCLLSWGCSSPVEFHEVNLEETTHFLKTICEVEGGISSVALNSIREGRMTVGSKSGEVLLFSGVSF